MRKIESKSLRINGVRITSLVADLFYQSDFSGNDYYTDNFHYFQPKKVFHKRKRKY